jgi:RsmE family RNA methyltransferase
VAEPGAAKTLGTMVRECGEERVLLAVGPEGGWNSFETALLEAHGFQSAGMGPRTLRTDTACVALLALVHEAIVVSSA